jgi:hypothetical protein
MIPAAELVGQYPGMAGVGVFALNLERTCRKNIRNNNGKLNRNTFTGAQHHISSTIGTFLISHHIDL